MATDGGGPSVSDAPPAQPAVRNDLVDTAARFLSGPRVAASPTEQQDAFLRAKGLNEAEIALARQRAQLQPPQHQQQLNGQQVVQLQRQYGGVGERLRTGASAIVLIAGVSYAAYTFCRQYLLPRFFNVLSPEQEERRLALERAEEMRNTLQFVMDSLNRLLQERSRQEQTLNRLIDALERNGIESNNSGDLQRSVNDVKNDMTVIKGLLLSKNQFAPAPFRSTGVPSTPSSSSSSPQAVNQQQHQPAINGCSAVVAQEPSLRPPAWQLAKSGGGDGGQKNGVDVEVEDEQGVDGDCDN